MKEPIEIKFAATAEITVVPSSDENGDQPVSIKNVVFVFSPDESLLQEAYFNPDKTMTAHAIHPASQCFIFGLIANIMYAHERGYEDSAKHLRYIIKHLEEGFVAQYKMRQGTLEQIRNGGGSDVKTDSTSKQ